MILKKSKKKRKALSLILCSRNDNYRGNSKYRLQATLNYTAKQIFKAGRESEVEIIVSDWGSRIPLRDIIKLSGQASKITSFLNVPKNIAKKLQKDSPFSEVHALNAVARRSNGEFIGRIDQDTLVGEKFFEVFFDLYQGKRKLKAPLSSSLIFANRRRIPYIFSVKEPSMKEIEKLIDTYKKYMVIENEFPEELFWHSYVGIWMTHRRIWFEAKGYDESYIYTNEMEVEMIHRLRRKYPIINIGKLDGTDYYHLSHDHAIKYYDHTRQADKKINPWVDLDKPLALLYPNHRNWGMKDYNLKLLRAHSEKYYKRISDTRITNHKKNIMWYGALGLILDRYYSWHTFSSWIERMIGLTGIAIKKISPEIYRKLRKIKEGFSLSSEKK